MAIRRSGHITRTVQRPLRSTSRQYGAVIGEVVLASNYVLMELQLLFGALVTPDHPHVAEAMWHTLSNDRPKLELLRAFVEGNTTIQNTARDRIVWAISKAEKLAEKRNDAVHATVAFDRTAKPYKVVPFKQGTHPARFRRLTVQHDLKRFFRSVKDDLHALSNYVRAVRIHLMYPARFALPQKPRLRSL